MLIEWLNGYVKLTDGSCDFCVFFSPLDPLPGERLQASGDARVWLETAIAGEDRGGPSCFHRRAPSNGLGQN